MSPIDKIRGVCYWGGCSVGTQLPTAMLTNNRGLYGMTVHQNLCQDSLVVKRLACPQEGDTKATRKAKLEVGHVEGGDL